MLNHHLLAKTTTDSVLSNFKTGTWSCAGGLGENFLRVGCDATFPSPDATFYDEAEKVLVAFEFKPPTETKRGILTGIGQAIAYLSSSQLSYLVAPQYLEDFRLGEYLENLFLTQIKEKLPVGLILYDNEDPTKVSLTTNVEAIGEGRAAANIVTERFWAKHQDLPIELFHLILHCYYLKRTHQIDDDAFAYCWKNFIVPKSIVETLEPISILDCSGKPIRTLAGNKDIKFLEKKIDGSKDKPIEERRKEIISAIDTEYCGDNYYNSVRKNFLSFLKHLRTIDSEGNLTDSGYKLYHIGLINTPSSKIFRDYFTREVLLSGNHLDLLLDMDSIIGKHRGENFLFNQILKEMEADYETKGYIKRNPNRKVSFTSKVGFLKYELILWRSLGLIEKKTNIINWRKITEICMLPDL